MGMSDAPDVLAASEPTAKTLNVRAVLAEPHLGHLIFSAPFIVRTSCSNFSPHWQVYS
jgi:hypothetical protein